jgi:hypothetical protein
MACGCIPVVSRVASGVSDIVRERHNGLTFPPDNLDALADCIEWLTENASELESMSRAARRAAQECSGYDRFLQRATAILDDAAAAPERPWPATRCLHMDAPEASGSATVPADAAGRVRSLLAHLANNGGGPVAIYGAGKHTRALAAAWADTPVPIVAVIDDDYTLAGRSLWGWPIVVPESARKTGARSVIISSWMHEDEIWQRRRAAFAAEGMQLHRLYTKASPEAALQPT